MADDRRQRDKDAPFFRRRADKRLEERFRSAPHPEPVPSQDQPEKQAPQPDKEQDTDWLFEQAKDRLAASNEAIRITRTSFFSLLSVAVYIGAVVWSTTDEQLLRVSPLKLPIVNIEVSLTGFYTFVPWLFVVLHFNLLINLGLTGQKLKTFLDDIAHLEPELSRRLRGDLANFPLAQWMVGQRDIILHFVFSVWTSFTLIMLPTVILFAIFLRFLDFQDQSLATYQVVAIVADSVLVGAFLWWFATRCQPGRLHFLFGDTRAAPILTRMSNFIALLLAALPAIATSFTLGFVFLTDLFSEQVPTMHRYINIDLREKFLTRNSVSPEIREDLASEDAQIRQQALSKLLGLDLRERHLKESIFERAVLPKADLRKAILVDSNFSGAYLQQANFRFANLDWADITDADLRNADLRGVENMETAILSGANLQGARIEGTFLDPAITPCDFLPAP